MTDELLMLGASHKTAPLALRERLALPESRAARVLHHAVAHEAILEAVSISTCNRSEMYMLTTDAIEAETAALASLSRQADIRPTELVDAIYSYRGSDAVRHLFSVAAGLDSMIVGEAEIQGQVKRAYESALGEGVTGPVTNRLFHAALGAGKRVRTETGVGHSRVSVATVAVELARAALGDLPEKRVLMVGTGDQGEVTARALREHGVHTVFVANRRYDRAISLAQRYNGRAVRFDDIPEELAEADIVITCTSSPHQILGLDDVALVLAGRGPEPLVVLDIAVPRDVDPEVRSLPGVTLFDMDDLQREVARNMSVREAEATRARTIVDQEVARFERWLASLDVVPTIAALRERGEEIVEAVLRENDSRWESLSEADRERLRLMARAVAQRLLHEPTLRLKGEIGDERSYLHVQALRELFGLDPAAATLEGARPDAEVTELDSHRRRR